jgi:predicted  nucleic acid-binding Zn-ribbon protein
MAITAGSLQELHRLHHRAKVLRDRLISGPKTLAARQIALANRQAALEAARKVHQEAKVQIKKREHLLQGHQSKIDDLTVKLNQAKKNDEYKAIQNQIAHDKAAISKIEDEVLEAYSQIEVQAAALAAQEAEAKAFAADVEALRAQIESQAGEQAAQLQELETAIIEAEDVIPIDHREQYRRIVKRHGADALAFIESDACSGCYVSITAQTKNELINGAMLCFCMTCGRILYLADEDIPNTRRAAPPVKGKRG